VPKFFKIVDVRVVLPKSGPPQITLKPPGPLGGFPIGDKFSAARGAVILDAFHAGVPLFWSDAGEVTSLPGVLPPADVNGTGTVVTWDVRVPATGKIDFYLGLRSDADKNKTSGAAAAFWVKMSVDEATANAVVALLTSSYCAFADGVLRNTQYQP
jgi:hypothetical protein